MITDDIGETDPLLRTALEELRRLSAVPPRTGAVWAARAAMHQVLEHRSAPAGAWFRRRLGRFGLALAVTSLVVGTGATLAYAAHARPSSPLHRIRLAEERVIYQLAGKNGPSIAVGFAESRLADARANVDRKDSVAEAQSWLKEARTANPADRSAGTSQKLEEVTREVGRQQQLEGQTGDSNSSKPPGGPAPTTAPPEQVGPGSGAPSPPQPTGGSDGGSPQGGPNN